MKKIIILIMEFLFAILLLISLYKLISYYKDSKENKYILDDISKSVKIDSIKDKYSVDFDKLLKKNSDTVAYLKVKNTNIEYPVVKSKDNEYYLNYNFEKKYNVGGWVFADYKNNFDDTDKNIVIYGHNMRDKSMFGTLNNVLDTNWQSKEENLKIIFITKNNQYTYKVFSTYKIENEEYYIKTDFNGNTEYSKFLNAIKERSNKDYNVQLNENDQILTLSSCDYNNKYRIVLHAKKERNND